MPEFWRRKEPDFKAPPDAPKRHPADMRPGARRVAAAFGIEYDEGADTIKRCGGFQREQAVNVKRTSGEMDSGWTIREFRVVDGGVTVRVRKITDVRKASTEKVV